MITADHEAELLRAEIARAVAVLREQGVSQMDAYARIGDAAGKSESWVRKHLGRNPSVGVRLRDFLNIRAAYDRLCARVEADNDRLDRELAELLGDAVAPARPAARQPAPPRSPRRRQDLRFRRAPLIPVSALAAA
ncbi:hypothetical protein [Methylobacterium sp. XJLW]|uniref:hypothetical protein n=1 Tax=Methylobacterium sp. XJLW TaxID=739141 RepID=UPI000F551555|nr:hypothetical protein [Methylobacterium sp. XJLW]